MNYWSYIAIFLMGIVAGFMIYIKIKAPDQVINENQRIGKIKNTGDGSTQNTSLVREMLGKVSLPSEKKPLLDRLFPGRQVRIAARKERRAARREERQRSEQPP